MNHYSDMIDVIEKLSEHTEKYYVYASGWLASLESIWGLNWYDKDYQKEVFACFPKLKELWENNDYETLFNDFVVLEFDSLEEMNSVYYDIVGDDGNCFQYSRNTNNYSGPCRVYAITIYNGNAHNENT